MNKDELLAYRNYEAKNYNFIPGFNSQPPKASPLHEKKKAVHH